MAAPQDNVSTGFRRSLLVAADSTSFGFVSSRITCVVKTSSGTVTVNLVGGGTLDLGAPNVIGKFIDIRAVGIASAGGGQFLVQGV